MARTMPWQDVCLSVYHLRRSLLMPGQQNNSVLDYLRCHLVREIAKTRTKSKERRLGVYDVGIKGCQVQYQMLRLYRWDSAINRSATNDATGGLAPGLCLIDRRHHANMHHVTSSTSPPASLVNLALFGYCFLFIRSRTLTACRENKSD